jgi:hypothetical protein
MFGGPSGIQPILGTRSERSKRIGRHQEKAQIAWLHLRSGDWAADWGVTPFFYPICKPELGALQARTSGSAAPTSNLLWFERVQIERARILATASPYRARWGRRPTVSCLAENGTVDDGPPLAGLVPHPARLRAPSRSFHGHGAPKTCRPFIHPRPSRCTCHSIHRQQRAAADGDLLCRPCRLQEAVDIRPTPPRSKAGERSTGFSNQNEEEDGTYTRHGGDRCDTGRRERRPAERRQRDRRRRRSSERSSLNIATSPA